MNGSPPSNLTVEQTLVWALLALHTNGSAQTVQEGGETLPAFLMHWRQTPSFSGPTCHFSRDGRGPLPRFGLGLGKRYKAGFQLASNRKAELWPPL